MSDAKREWTPPAVDADPKLADAVGGWTGKSLNGRSVRNVHPYQNGWSIGSVKTQSGRWMQSQATILKP